MAIQATQESGDSAFNRGKTVRAHEYLEELGVEHFYDLKYGSHRLGRNGEMHLQHLLKIFYGVMNILENLLIKPV